MEFLSFPGTRLPERADQAAVDGEDIALRGHSAQPIPAVIDSGVADP